MKIFPVSSYNQINFTSKVTRVINGSVPDNIKEQVDIFEETNGKNAKKLGQGLFAEAYLIKGTKCVIKKSKPGKPAAINGDFSQEAKALLNIPSGFTHAQRLIGNVETEDENFYLLSTFVDGKIPDGDKIKWNKESLSSILSSLADLDAARVYHGDVSRCNCLITEDDEVNLLDFQYCDKFDIKGDETHRINAEKYKVPYFIAPSNAQMFEEANLATYLTTIDENEARELFKTYLSEKSKYHLKRAKEFSKQGARPEIIQYEGLMAKYLKNPSDEMIKLQAMKMQILSTHRFVLSAMDTRKQDDLYNIMSAPVYYLHAIEDSNKMAEYASSLCADKTDPDLQKLLTYEKENALFWRSLMKNELAGRYGNNSAFEWILRNAKQSPRNYMDDIGTTFIKTGHLKHREIPDIYSMLSGTDVLFGFEEETEDNISKRMGSVITELRKTQCFVSPIKSVTYKDIKDYHKTKQEIMKSLKAAREVYMEGCKYESLFYSLNALYQSSIAQNKASKIINGGKLSYGERRNMVKESEFLAWYKNELENLNCQLYEKLFEKASN